MAINVQYGPSAQVIGEAAFAVGQGMRAREDDQIAWQRQRAAEELALRQEQFAQSMGLRQQQLGMGRQSEIMALQERERARQYDALQRALSRDQQSQMMGMQMGMHQDRMAAGLQDQQQRMQFEAWRQGQMADRQEGQIEAQMRMQRQAQLGRRMEADWAAIQKQLPFLDEDSRQDLVDQFQQKYSAADEQMPMPMPEQAEMPEEMDPIKQIQRLREEHPDVPWVPGSDGFPMVPRGFRQDMDPKYRAEQQREKEAELQAEQLMEEQKLQAEQAKQDQQQRQAYNTALANAEQAGRKMYMHSMGPGMKPEFDRTGFQEYMQETKKHLAAAYGQELPDEPSGGGGKRARRYEWEEQAEQYDLRRGVSYDDVPVGAYYTHRNGSVRRKKE